MRELDLGGSLSHKRWGDADSPGSRPWFRPSPLHGTPPLRGTHPPSQLPLQPGTRLGKELQDRPDTEQRTEKKKKKSAHSRALLNSNQSFNPNRRPPTRLPGSNRSFRQHRC